MTRASAREMIGRILRKFPILSQGLPGQYYLSCFTLFQVFQIPYLTPKLLTAKSMQHEKQSGISSAAESPSSMTPTVATRGSTSPPRPSKHVALPFTLQPQTPTQLPRDSPSPKQSPRLSPVPSTTMPPKPKLNVHSFPRPPLCEKTPRHLQIKWRGQTIADTKDAFWVLETTHPPSTSSPPLPHPKPKKKTTV